MAYTIDYGYTRSETTKNITVARPNYSDWTVSQETRKTDNQLQRDWVNLTSPSDRVAHLRVWNKSVADVYQSSDINVANQAPVKTGVRIGCMQEAILSISEESDSPAASCCDRDPVYAPITFTGQLMCIKHPAITPDVMRQYLLDCINKWFPEESTTSDQINQWSKGALNLLS